MYRAMSPAHTIDSVSAGIIAHVSINNNLYLQLKIANPTWRISEATTLESHIMQSFILIFTSLV